jgi:transcriptional regulator with XRE-family HTH domain
MSRTVHINPQEVTRLFEEKGWTMTKLAAQADLKLTTVSRALDGRGVRMSTVTDLAEALDVPISQILRHDGQVDVAPVGQNGQDIVENAKLEQDIMNRAMAEPSLYQLTDHMVSQLQDDPVLGPGSLVQGANGRSYPFVCYPLNGNPGTPVDTDTHRILGTVESRRVENSFEISPEASQYWLAMEKIAHATDRPTFRLNAVRRENGLLKLDAILGSYRDSIVSEVMLERELLLAIGKRPSKLTADQYGGFLGKLPFRAATTARLDRPSQLLQGTTVRSAALAVSILVVCPDDQGRWVTPIRLRSGSGVSSHPHMFHTVPSGMLHRRPAIMTNSGTSATFSTANSLKKSSTRNSTRSPRSGITHSHRSSS